MFSALALTSLENGAGLHTGQVLTELLIPVKDFCSPKILMGLRVILLYQNT